MLWLGGQQRSEAIVIPFGSVVLGEGIGSIAVHGEGVVACVRLCVCLCFCSCVAARASCLRYWWRGANTSIRLVYIDICTWSCICPAQQGAHRRHTVSVLAQFRIQQHVRHRW